MAPAPDIDDLFQLPLSEFTAARNALAATLKASGRGDEAAAVKALPKPPVSAWAVNQLYWGHRKSFDQLIANGEQLRKAQGAELGGKGEGGKGEGGKGEAGGGKSDLRSLLEARRQDLSELTRRAAALLREAGHPAGPDVMRRISTTLEALATYGNQPGGPSPGHLSADVDPPGFEALASLVPVAGSRPAARSRSSGSSRVIPFRPPDPPPRPKKLDPAARKRLEEQERQAERARAAAAVRDAERALREARAAAARAEAALKKAAARAKVAEKEKAALEAQLEKASAEADAARIDARKVASAAEEAAQAVTDAEDQLKAVKSKL
jgi:hypothetical protein